MAGVVNTMPAATLEAVANHGDIRGDTVTGTQAESARVLADLAGLGIDIDKVTAAVEVEGVEKFKKSWSELLAKVTDGLTLATPNDA